MTDRLKLRCPYCKTASTVPHDGPMDLHGVAVQARGEKCETCERITYSAAQIVRNEHEAAAEIVATGIRTGRQFRFLRKVAGLTRMDVSRALAVSVTAVRGWDESAGPPPPNAVCLVARVWRA